MASLPQLGMGPYSKYPSRAVAAAISKYFLLVVAVLGVVGLPFVGFDFENIIIVAGLVTVTFSNTACTATFANVIPGRPVSVFAINHVLPAPSWSIAFITPSPFFRFRTIR